MLVSDTIVRMVPGLGELVKIPGLLMRISGVIGVLLSTPAPAGSLIDISVGEPLSAVPPQAETLRRSN